MLIQVYDGDNIYWISSDNILTISEPWENKDGEWIVAMELKQYCANATIHHNETQMHHLLCYTFSHIENNEVLAKGFIERVISACGGQYEAI